MEHLALLGDSILDNAPYVRPQPDTADLLQRALGSGWSVQLLARDGSTMSDLRFQLSQLGPKVDVAVLSVGGNDAVDHIGLLEPRSTNNLRFLSELLEIADRFADAYEAVMVDIGKRARRLLVCTIYEPPLSDPTLARLALVPLSLLNDRIIRAAARAGVDIIDLRAVCTDPTDFVKEIEPSPSGARKIAMAIQRAVQRSADAGVSSLFAV